LLGKAVALLMALGAHEAIRDIATMYAQKAAEHYKPFDKALRMIRDEP